MHYTASLLVLIAAVLWGTTGTAQSFFDGTAHPLSIWTFRLAMGIFFIAAFRAGLWKIVSSLDSMACCHAVCH